MPECGGSLRVRHRVGLLKPVIEHAIDVGHFAHAGVQGACHADILRVMALGEPQAVPQLAPVQAAPVRLVEVAGLGVAAELAAEQSQAFAEHGLVGGERVLEHGDFAGRLRTRLGLFGHLAQLGDAELAPAGLAHIRAGVLQRVQQVFDIAAVEDVVVVGERDVLTMRGIEAGVLGLGDAAVFLMDHGDAAVLRRILIADGRAGILGPVVHQNHLEVRIRLLQNGVHAVAQVVFGVVYRHDYGNEGSGVDWQDLCFLFVYADVSSIARFLAELRNV